MEWQGYQKFWVAGIGFVLQLVNAASTTMFELPLEVTTGVAAGLAFLTAFAVKHFANE